MPAASPVKVTRENGTRTYGRFPRSEPLKKLRSWIAAIRLQFYPMTWIAYTAGALGAAFAGHTMDLHTYFSGYAFLFFLEVATVLSNDYFDYDSDRINEFFSSFSGGSRVLVDGRLSTKELRIGIVLSLVLAASSAAYALVVSEGNPAMIIATFLVLAVLGLAYTIPPIKLSHRSLGEMDVAITHSAGVIVSGYVLQQGTLLEPFAWLLSVPLFFSILPAIILAGIPDYIADRSVGKITLVVRVGPHHAVLLAITATFTAVTVGTLWQILEVCKGAYAGFALFALPHGLVLLVLLYRYWKKGITPGRINHLLVFSLLFIQWFGVIPMVNFLPF